MRSSSLRAFRSLEASGLSECSGSFVRFGHPASLTSDLHTTICFFWPRPTFGSESEVVLTRFCIACVLDCESDG